MITPEQARAELERRRQQTSAITPEQARAELERRLIEKKDAGIVRNIAGSIVRPFERLAASALEQGGGTAAFIADRLTPNALTGGKNVYASRQDAVNQNRNVFDKGFSATRALTGETPKPVKNVADLTGTALEAASVVAPVVRAPAFFGKVAKGSIGKAAAEGALTAGAAGFVGGTGRGLQEGKDVGSALEQGAIEGAIGAPIGLALGGVAGSLVRAPKLATKTGRDTIRLEGAKSNFAKDLDNVLSTKSLQTKVNDLQKQNVPIKDILNDLNIAQGIKVQDKKVVVDEAVEAIQKNLDKAQNAKARLLPEADRFVPKTSKEEIRKLAIADISGKQLELDEKAIIERINKQLDAFPDEMTLKELDLRRAKARNSAVDAKGQQKSDSEYAAIENALRKVLFDKTDNLPEGVDADGSIRGLNSYIRQQLKAQEFLDKSLRGQTVKGGRLGEYFARGIGAVAGSQGGILGALAGSEIAGYVSNVVSNNVLGSSVKMRLIREAAEETADPKIIQAAEELIQKLKLRQFPALPPRSMPFQSKIESGRPIQLGVSTVDEKGVQRIPNMSLQNTANNTVTMNANTSIPQSSAPQQGLSSRLSTAIKERADLFKDPKNLEKGFIKNPFAQDVVQNTDTPAFPKRKAVPPKGLQQESKNVSLPSDNDTPQPLSRELISEIERRKRPIPRSAEEITPEYKKNISDIIDVLRGVNKVSDVKKDELLSDMAAIIEDLGFGIPRTTAGKVKLLELIYRGEI